jgi:hypothetical protein
MNTAWEITLRASRQTENAFAISNTPAISSLPNYFKPAVCLEAMVLSIRYEKVFKSRSDTYIYIYIYIYICIHTRTGIATEVLRCHFEIKYWTRATFYYDGGEFLTNSTKISTWEAPVHEISRLLCNRNLTNVFTKARNWVPSWTVSPHPHALYFILSTVKKINTFMYTVTGTTARTELKVHSFRKRILLPVLLSCTHLNCILAFLHLTALRLEYDKTVLKIFWKLKQRI